MEWERRFTHHYMVIGLVFLLAGIAFDQKNHDTCSSWLARVTQKVGLQEWKKPFPLVTPRDVYEQLGKDSCAGTLVFEGTLAELVEGSAAVAASEAGCVAATAAASESLGTGRGWRPRPAMN